MPTLLILNPNTGQATSERLLALARPLAGNGVVLRQATARFGATYISDEVSAIVAGHAALDAYSVDAASHGEPDAVLLACFGDPGLFALRELAAGPVFGLAQAAMQQAGEYGPFVVVTAGAAWEPMLHRLALALRLDHPLLGVHTLDSSGGEIARQGLAAVPALRAACEQALQRWPQARSVLLGGAGLAGLADAVGPVSGVPVLDNWHVAVQSALRCLAGDPLSPEPHRVALVPSTQRLRFGPTPAVDAVNLLAAATGWQGLAPELQALLHSRSRPDPAP